ncbi:HAD-IA family hydrolase [Cyanobacterium stanieri LEGE 03274]|uniref:HAD-IA family hydrolase n=1 Tax=Cyanobacterium stanieri LEGE 03274 TaxID=1828756 RepID=A0ABR9V4E1_9CHRO|nr:HAD-IA family hydrolase [Cyanobacterium stanieri]MBE9222762.1 HAD-IA family hydrolase [Cyanobacterium stanieri LEGE 03274]
MKPQVIFLDAVGTLFGVKNNVGWAYTQISQKYGVNYDSQLVNQAFYQSFQISSPLCFDTQSENLIKSLEFDWWKKIAENTFQSLNLLDQFTNFDDFFIELYQHFSTEKPWYIYNDVIFNLNLWQKQGINLAIISNFDTRIFSVLDSLDLSKYFSSITISSLSGMAKPHPNIFRQALETNNCFPENAWYIGDSKKEDYWGAKSVGMKAFWLSR